MKGKEGASKGCLDDVRLFEDYQTLLAAQQHPGKRRRPQNVHRKGKQQTEDVSGQIYN